MRKSSQTFANLACVEISSIKAAPERAAYFALGVSGRPGLELLGEILELGRDLRPVGLQSTLNLGDVG